jgi:DNA-3-methyladenine glycosylase
LLGAVLVSTIGSSPVAVKLNEVEAYRGDDDQASHAFKGLTGRNASMFARPGTLYVYRSYGMHWCANVSAGPEGTGWAILFRGGEVSGDVGTSRARRGRDTDLANGPGKLCQALGIDGSHDGTNLFDDDSPLRLEPGSPPQLVMATPRIGISKARDLPWRFIAATSTANGG